MAFAPTDPGRAADNVVLSLKIADIEIGERIGILFPLKAAAFGKLILADGQHDPIKVARQSGKQPWKLVTGLHRITGMFGAGFEHINAIEVFGDLHTLQAIEASENMDRRPIGPIERACFVAAMADVARTKVITAHGNASQQSIAIKARWDRSKLTDERVSRDVDGVATDTTANLAGVYGWSDEIAESMGLSARAVYRSLAIFRAIVAPDPDQAKRLASRPIGDNAAELDKLVKIKSDAVRQRVIAALLAYPAAGVDDAQVMLGIKAEGSVIDPVGKHHNAIRGAWGRLSITDKRGFLPEFVALLTPGLKDELKALIEESIDAK